MLFVAIGGIGFHKHMYFNLYLIRFDLNRIEFKFGLFFSKEETFPWNTQFFSASEPKAKVHYCDHALSVVRPSLTFHIFYFSSETTEQNSTKLDRKQEPNILYQVCVFRADRKNKMAALASDWLRHFRLLLWNRWTELKLDRKQDLNILYQVFVFRADQ